MDKIHLRNSPLGDDLLYATVCGRRVPPQESTTNRQQTTCLECLQTSSPGWLKMPTWQPSADDFDLGMEQ